jgi:hypothetical protein
MLREEYEEARFVRNSRQKSDTSQVKTPQQSARKNLSQLNLLKMFFSLSRRLDRQICASVGKSFTLAVPHHFGIGPMIAARASAWKRPFVARMSGRNGSKGKPSIVVSIPPASATSTAPANTSQA